MSKTEGTAPEAIIGGIVAVAIAAGGLYLILDKATPIVAAPTATPTPQPRVAAPPPLVTSTAGRPEAQVPPVPSGPAVYRCQVNGTTTYSDTPCLGGEVIDARPATQGFVPTPVRRGAVVAQSADDEQPASASATSEKAARDARCAWIEKAIESVDAQARQGHTVVTQDRLREERQKLVDERFALKC
jgi:hypothetical protein